MQKKSYFLQSNFFFSLFMLFYNYYPFFIAILSIEKLKKIKDIEKSIEAASTRKKPLLCIIVIDVKKSILYIFTKPLML